MGRYHKFRGPKTVPNKDNFNPRLSVADIDVKDFNSLIYKKGVKVRVYKTLWCPNIKSIDGAEHNVDCPLCFGTEYLDLDPIDTYAVLQGQTKDWTINPENLGSNWEEAITMATFIGGVEVSYYTKVELQDFTQDMKELVQRQITGPQSPIVSAFQPIAYDPSTGIVTVPDTSDLTQIQTDDIFIDAAGHRFLIIGDIVLTSGLKSFTIFPHKVVNLGMNAVVVRPDIDKLKYDAIKVDIVVDRLGNRYYPEKDFLVDRNGNIAWITDASSSIPPNQDFYTVYYHTLVAYRAIRALHSDRYGAVQSKLKEIENIEYPQQWVLKKLFLFQKTDSVTGQQLLPNQVLPGITNGDSGLAMENQNDFQLEDGTGNIVQES